VSEIDAEWQEVSWNGNYEATRAIMLADLDDAIREDQLHRAKGDLAHHVFDTLLAC